MWPCPHSIQYSFLRKCCRERWRQQADQGHEETSSFRATVNTTAQESVLQKTMIYRSCSLHNCRCFPALSTHPNQLCSGLLILIVNLLAVSTHTNHFLQYIEYGQKLRAIYQQTLPINGKLPSPSKCYTELALISKDGVIGALADKILRKKQPRMMRPRRPGKAMEEQRRRCLPWVIF